jgi:hypothetical protein
MVISGLATMIIIPAVITLLERRMFQGGAGENG